MREPLIIVVAINEAFAMPLAVTIRSVLENLASETEIRLFVLADAVPPETRAKIERSWEPYAISTHWIVPDYASIAHLLVSHGHSGVPASYFRMLMAELLPASVERAVYLDSDIVVTGDLTPLGELAFEGNLVLAVPDAYRRSHHVLRLSALELTETSRFTEHDRYFNSGVMVVDIAGWRQAGIAREAVAFAARHGDAIIYHDQDVLNCILKGRWGALAPIWNLHEMPHSLRTWECYSPDPDERRELIRAPRVVHFVSSDKPWHAICFHGFQQPQFLDALSRTEFRDYRVPDLPLGQRLFHYGLVYPSVLINWGLWRGLIHARDPQILAWLCQQILRRPWGLLTYPAWLCFMSLRDLWRARGRAP